MTRRHAVTVVLCSWLALALPAQAARADDDPPTLQKMRFIERGDVLTVNTSITKLFDTAAYSALESGFTSTVVIRLWVYPKGSTSPVGFALLQRTVLYNPWDEVFEIQIIEPGVPPHVVKVKRQADALKQLTSLDNVAIAKLADLPYEQIFLLAMQVELNPVSKETLAEVRRWLTQGTGGGQIAAARSSARSCPCSSIPRLPRQTACCGFARSRSIARSPRRRPRPRAGARRGIAALSPRAPCKSHPSVVAPPASRCS